MVDEQQADEPGQSNRPEQAPETRDEFGRFVPGCCPNPTGRPKGSRSLTAILRKILEQRVNPRDPDDLRTRGELLMDVAVQHAAEGNASFFKELIERMDGKVPDRILTDLGPDWEYIYETPPIAASDAEASTSKDGAA
jgi:hypothetical protein